MSGKAVPVVELWLYAKVVIDEHSSCMMLFVITFTNVSMMLAHISL